MPTDIALIHALHKTFTPLSGKGDATDLAVYLRSDAALDGDGREALAFWIENHFAPRGAGRPAKAKHGPASRAKAVADHLARCLCGEGKHEAAVEVAKQFGVKYRTVLNWVKEARERADEMEKYAPN